jgi:hypothetical protein
MMSTSRVHPVHRNRPTFQGRLVSITETSPTSKTALILFVDATQGEDPLVFLLSYPWGGSILKQALKNRNKFRHSWETTLGRQGEADGNLEAAIGVVASGDGAAVDLDRTAGDGEAEASAASHALS